MYGNRVVKQMNSIQNAEETILYLLTRQETFIVDYGHVITYGVSIYRYLADALADSYVISDFSTKFDAAWNLVQKLRRNNIKPSQADEIVEDHLI